MAEQGKDLTVVHFQIDSIDGLETIRIRLLQVLDLEVLVFKLHASNLGSDRLIVLLLQVFKLKWVADLVVIACAQSITTLELFLIKVWLITLFVLGLPAATAAELLAEAEAACLLLSILPWQYLIQIESKQGEDEEGQSEHHESGDVCVVVDVLSCIREIEANLAALKVAENGT